MKELCGPATSQPPASALAAQRASILYPLVGALLLPFVIGVFQPVLILRLFNYFSLFVGFCVPPLIVGKILFDWVRHEHGIFQGIWRYIRPIPSGVAFGTDLNQAYFPWVTTTLVIINGCLYYGLSDDTVQRFIFPPSGDPSLLNVLLSVLTHAFLHADAAHLWGNMLFLWAFGSTLEPRIGTRRYLIAYGLGIVFSTVLPVLLLIVQAVYRATLSELTVYPTLGASGAISCIMGLFIVRCYFARVSMSFPFLFLPFLSLSLRLQAILFAGLFFTFDIAGSVRQFADDAGGVDYWAHVGGYVGGFGLAYLWHIHQAAAKEAVQVKAARLRGHLIRGNEAAHLCAEILDEDPENEAALRYFLHWYKRSSKEAAEYYVRLIQVLLRTDIRQAVDVFDTYFPRHMYALPGVVLFRFGTYFYHEGEFVKAGYCLDMAAERPGPWQPKAMLLLGKTLEALGNAEDATQLYQAVAEQYPESTFQAAALEKLATIPGLGSGATKRYLS